ncbi:hypothetical protein [Cellulomonas xylanilytica]|uniref:Uncharacterized protein n=1 Tax=Cellulomonas xylanilytica TaxID=233583 RepID=A0A510UZJ6_9CELL|nr:hypothetical protein [Cellulomonas xylanilytica]GEK20067.1 hypothetical protein CXY01_05870 [Cellulomonas xylanilytica]
MTVQGAAGMRWLLRAVLVVAAGLLVALLTALWSAASARAAVEPVGDVGGVTPTALEPMAVLTSDGGVDPVPVPALDPVLDPALDPGLDPVLDPVVETVGTVVPETTGPVAVPVTLAAAPDAVPDAEPVTVVTVAVPEVVPDAVVPVLAPVTETVEQAVLPVVSVVTAPITAALPPVASAPEPVGDVLQPVATATVPAPAKHGPAAGAATVTTQLVPSAPAVTVVPCATVAPPDVSTARPSPTRLPGGDGSAPLPDDPLPMVASPPSVEHLRSQTTRDDARPSGAPTTSLPPAGSGTASGERSGADGDLPAELEPPQLRVLSARAGPGPTLLVAPKIEILDSPA